LDEKNCVQTNFSPKTFGPKTFESKKIQGPKNARLEKFGEKKNFKSKAF